MSIKRAIDLQPGEVVSGEYKPYAPTRWDQPFAAPMRIESIRVTHWHNGTPLFVQPIYVGGLSGNQYGPHALVTVQP